MYSLGHRQFKYIYKQRYRAEDQREAVVINKLRAEYRDMMKKMLKNCGVSDSLLSAAKKPAEASALEKRRALQIGMRNNGLQHTFRQATP